MARARQSFLAVLLVGVAVAGCTSAPAATGTVSSALTFGGTAYTLPDRPTSTAGSPGSARSSTLAGTSSASAPGTSGRPTGPPSTPGPTSSAAPRSSGASAGTTGTSATTKAAPPDSVTKRNSSTAPTDALSVTEISDRRAIEAAWRQFWVVSNEIVRTPKAKRAALLATVAVEPDAAALLANAVAFDAHHFDNYGLPVHSFYWGPSVHGESSAVVGDCMDFSAVGRSNAITGEHLTVGLPKQNFHVTLVREGAGPWKVSTHQFLSGVSC